jgi:hypothetical protein
MDFTTKQQEAIQKLSPMFIEWFELRFRPVDYSDDYFWAWVWRWDSGFKSFWSEMDSTSRERWIEVLQKNINS